MKKTVKQSPKAPVVTQQSMPPQMKKGGMVKSSKKK